MSYGYGEETPIVGNDRHTQYDALDQLEHRIDSLATHTDRISGLTQKINTPEDNERLRHNLKQEREEATHLVRDIAESLKNSANVGDKNKFSSLLQTFQQCVAKFRQVTESSIQRERAFPLQQTPGTDNYGGGNNQQATDLRGFVPQQQLDINLTEVSERAIDNRIIRERNSEFKELSKDLDALQDVYVDAAKLIDEQGEWLSASEVKTDRAVGHAKIAVKDMDSAFKLQKKSRRKQFCIIGIIFCVMLVVACVVGVIIWQIVEHVMK